MFGMLPTRVEVFDTMQPGSQDNINLQRPEDGKKAFPVRKEKATRRLFVDAFSSQF